MTSLFQPIEILGYIIAYGFTPYIATEYDMHMSWC